MTEQDKEMLERQVELLRRMSPRLDMLDCENVLTAADRIEELVKERDENDALATKYMDLAEALRDNLAKAVEALRFLIEATTVPEANICITRALADARAVLAELEGKG